MNTILHKHTPEILSIAHENHVGYDIACQMFVNNIDDAGDPNDQYTYPGADEVDYAVLKAEMPAKKTQERADMTSVSRNGAMTIFPSCRSLSAMCWRPARRTPLKISVPL